MEKNFRDRVRGCLIAGAIGDALGYAVEFDQWPTIRRRYGESGIQALECDPRTGTAIISDDTQMTLFTANGLLLSEARGQRTAEGWIYAAYLDWLLTQRPNARSERLCWLNGISELNAWRAPGNTCLGALKSGTMGSVDEPINNSKGCGGVMRVAPVAAYGAAKGWDEERIVRLGAEAAAITHGHPLGWMSAAAMVDIVYRELHGAPPRQAVEESIDALRRIYGADDPWAQRLTAGMERALALTEDMDGSDLQHLSRLGEGWVGDEALYVAIYCAVKYADDFDTAMTVSVNHSGDSDSTGAVTGNILGAHWGCEAIPSRWKEKLELHDVILQVADDLCAPEAQRDGGWYGRYGK